jgi:hypothetical protein
MATDVIAITVSTNYDDLLRIIMPQNAKFFKKWYIITMETDAKTIGLVREFNYPNVELIYYNFKQPNMPFNKGGGLRKAQLHVLETHGEVPTLILDSDIYLPDDFPEIYNSTSIERDKLYSVMRRTDYEKYSDFKSRKNGIIHICSADFIGFFQLYIQTAKKLYKDYKDCGQCDLFFRDLFTTHLPDAVKHGTNTMVDDFRRFKFYKTHNCILMPLSVCHLGSEHKNWSGRTVCDFLVDDGPAAVA